MKGILDYNGGKWEPVKPQRIADAVGMIDDHSENMQKVFAVLMATERILQDGSMTEDEAETATYLIRDARERLTTIDANVFRFFELLHGGDEA